MAMMIRSLRFLVVATLFSAVPAGAQGVYVNASAGVSVLRFSEVEQSEVGSISRGGEPASWSLRLGTPLGQRWGVELEFVRTLETTKETTFDLFGGIPDGLMLPGYGFTTAGLFTPGLPLPSVDVRYRIRERQSSLVPTLWYRTDVSSKVAMVFLGGVAFNRSVEGVDVSIPTLPRFPNISTSLGPSTNRFTDYGTGAVAGVEARIGLGDNLQLIPGARLQSLGGGWSLRPAVGIGWQF